MDVNKLFLRLGIDVGGTNTDVVCLKDVGTDTKISQLIVLASSKCPTTSDVTSGIVRAVKQALKQVYQEYGSNHSIWITSVRIGTTHFVNAIKERSNKLSKVSVIRLSGKTSTAHQPFIDIPVDLRKIIQGPSFCVDGGYQYDGTPLTDFDSFIQNNIHNNNKNSNISLDEIVAIIQKHSIKSIAIVGVFSPSKNDQEIKMCQVLQNKLRDEYCKDLHITLSHEIAGLGLIERENASILNASLDKLAQYTVSSFELAMKELGIDAPLYLTKNDGTICQIEQVLKYPIRTFASGPTNSMKGCALLLSNILGFTSGNYKVMVIDIGGTTSDCGLLINGFPQLSATTVKLGDIRTNYLMPNVVSIALGGGTVIKFKMNKIANFKNRDYVIVGPESVGYQLNKSLCFGGDTLTVTDIALYKGWINKKSFDSLVAIYNRQVSIENIVKNITNNYGKNNVDLLDIAADAILAKLRELINQVKSEKEDIDLILCGGGARLIPNTFGCEGISKVLVPKYCEVANAVGATCNQISGEIECVVSMANKDRGEEISKLKAQAIEMAFKNGCTNRDTIKIASIDEIPLAYTPGARSKFTIKAIGDLDESVDLKKCKQWTPDKSLLEYVNNKRSYNNNTNNSVDVKEKAEKLEAEKNSENKANKFAKQQQQQMVDDEKQIGDLWTLTERDIEYLALGCGVLGTGGGGNPYYEKIKLIDLIRNGAKINIIDPDTKNTNLLSSDMNVLTCDFMGAPAISLEKLYSEEQTTGVIYQMIDYLKQKEKDKFCNKIALICGEIGGANGLTPLICAALLNKEKTNINGEHINVINGDFMGRAFPELQMTVGCMYGKNSWPIALQDDNNRKYLLADCKSDKDAEDILREKCVEWGMIAAMSSMPLKGKEIQDKNQKVCIKYTYTLAWNIGKIIYQERLKHENPLFKIEKFIVGSKIAYYGKIIDLNRQNNKGFNTGVIVIKNLAKKGDVNYFIQSDMISIDLQNENLVIREGNVNEKNKIGKKSKIIVSVPDLIVLFDHEFNSIATENLRYGLHCYVMVIPANPLLTSKEALKIVGPRAFGYDIDYKPLGMIVSKY